jgi:xanthine dehydrogenase YagT iron-sulfur-binding subunit
VIESPRSADATAGVRVQLVVNGERHALVVDPRTTVLDLVREHLGLTGTKRVCDRGECGACTVLLDGRPVYACLALACACAGARVTTIEGLGRSGRLHPMQRAFLEADAVQCGYCTPGQVLSATALLEQHPRPTLAQIRASLAGNLCRCGTYPKVVRAVRIASRRLTAR